MTKQQMSAEVFLLLFLFKGQAVLFCFQKEMTIHLVFIHWFLVTGLSNERYDLEILQHDQHC